MITHYGLFWSAADVLWSGVRGSPGHLRGREKIRLERQGRPSKKESDEAKDFSSYVGVYCLYRASQLVYVGEAGLANKSHLFNRLRAHRSDYLADRWDEFSWFGRENLNNTRDPVAASLAQLEAVLISVTNPGFNKQGGTFSSAQQVFQVPHDEAEGDLDTKLGRLMDKLDAIEEKLTPKKRGPRPKGVTD